MLKIVSPVLENLSCGKLVEKLPSYLNADRMKFAPLEAFGRISCGFLPWLNSNTSTIREKKLQKKYLDMYLKCLDMATNPDSKDYMCFCETDGIRQPLVDAAFLCQGLLRADNILSNLEERVKVNLIAALNQSRKIVPYNTNWVLFSAMVETMLFKLGVDFDIEKIKLSVIKILEWYKGDGIYGDGPEFRFDYYNSFVIHPMLLDIVDTFPDEFAEIRDCIILRSKRYAEILQRMISPEGAYPMVGRSLCYRFGVFHLLSLMVYKKYLDSQLTGGGILSETRYALTSVIKRTMSARGMFDANGYLRPGAIGFNFELAENYINVGSLYLCTSVFCALGLDENDEFWKNKNEAWINKKIYNGTESKIDHAYVEKNSTVEKFIKKSKKVSEIAIQIEEVFELLHKSRMDLKVENPELPESDIELKIPENKNKCRITKPKWFAKDGVGYVFESSDSSAQIKVTCLNDGKFRLWLRGKDVRKKGKRLPLFVKYEFLKINGKNILPEAKSFSHDKSFKYELDVKKGDVLKIDASWNEHNYSNKEERDTMIKQLLEKD